MKRVEAYRLANDSIKVSEQKKAEIMAMAKAKAAAPAEKKYPFRKGLALGAGLAAVLCICFVVWKSVPRDPRPVEPSVTVLQNAADVIFNPPKEIFDKSAKINTPAEEYLNFEDLPEYIKSDMPKIPAGFKASSSSFYIRYGSSKEEYFIEEKQYTNINNDSILKMGGIKLIHEENPLESLRPSKFNVNHSPVYFLNTKYDRHWRAYYLSEDGTIYHIFGENMSQNEFITCVKDALPS